MRSVLPNMIPPCEAPISLSALAVTMSAPAVIDWASVGSGANPNFEKSISEPAPISSIITRSLEWAISTSSSRPTSEEKPWIL